jgi:hypothetical protein
MTFSKCFKEIVLAALLFSSGMVQAQPSENKLSQAVEGMYALFQATSAGHPTFYIKEEKITNEQGAIIGYTVRNLSFESQGYGYEGFTNSVFRKLVLEVDGDAIVGKESRANCMNHPLYFSWNGDKLTEVGTSYTTFKLKHDDKDRIIELHGSGWAKTNSKKGYRRSYIILSYDGQGRIKSAEQIEESGTGASSDAVKSELLYTTSRKTIEYLEHDLIKVTFIEYARKLKTKDPDVVRRTRVLQYNLGQNTTVHTDYSNEKLVGKKEIEVTGPGAVKIITDDFSSGIQQVLSCTLDERGWLIRILEEGTKADKSKELAIERIYTYVRNQDATGETPCDYKVEELVRYFDSEGNAIREAKNSRIRNKQPNGDWSEWRLVH